MEETQSRRSLKEIEAEILEETQSRRSLKEIEAERSAAPWYDMLERLLPYHDLVLMFGLAMVLAAVGHLLSFWWALLLAGLWLIALAYVMAKSE